MFRCIRPLIWVPLVVLLIPGSAAAQPVTVSQLSGHVKLGETVSVIGIDGRHAHGRIMNLTAGSVTVSGDYSDERTFSLDEVRQVVVVDSVTNGAIKGLGVGAIPGLMLGTFAHGYCQNKRSGACLPSLTVPLAIAAGLGAALGAGVDALNRRTFNLMPPKGSALTVAPVASADYRGIQLSLQF